MPFNQTAGTGYVITLAIQILAILVVGEIICMLNTLFFAICWYVDTFVRDLTGIIKQIDNLWIQQINDFDDYLEMDLLCDKQTFALFRDFLIFNENILR